MRFLNRRNIDLELRIRKREFLHLHELDALCDFSQKKVHMLPAHVEVGQVFNLEEMEGALDCVNSGTQYARLTVVAKYIKWISEHLLSNNDADDAQRIAALYEQICSRRPRKKGRNEDAVDRSLSDEQLDVLLNLLKPGSVNNPFLESVQQRNYVMMLILMDLGIRGGELLNIKIQDIDFARQTIRCVRRADEKSDSRKKQGNVKTLTRLLPLSDKLVSEISAYITRERRGYKKLNDEGYLFLVHKAGPTCGSPLSLQGYYKIISVIRSRERDLYGLTGHRLRHSWNRKFSEYMDSMDSPPTEARQEQIRSALMGWKQGSGTAAHYNKRFIQKKAIEAALSLQKTSGTRLPKGLLDE